METNSFGLGLAIAGLLHLVSRAKHNTHEHNLTWGFILALFTLYFLSNIL